MKFAYIPKGEYKINQVIRVLGRLMVVESYTHTGSNVIVHTPPNAPKFERIVCICIDNEPVKGEPS